MSYIVSFKIEGLAGRQDPLEIELNRDTNIFFGPNGSGKTSLLKILHSAMCNETDLLSRVPFTSAQVKIYSEHWDKVYTRSIQKTGKSLKRNTKLKKEAYLKEIMSKEDSYFKDIVKEKKLKWTCKPESPAKASTTHWKHKYLPTSRLHVNDKWIPPYYDPPSPTHTQLTEDQLDSVFAHSVEGLWKVYSTQILKEVRATQEQGLASILQAVLSTGKKRKMKDSSKLTTAMAYERVRNFLKRQGSVSILGSQRDFDKRYSKDETLQDVVKDIDSVEISIEAAMASRNSLQKLITKMFTPNKEISFSDESIEVKAPSGEKIGLALLSSGEKHLLRILVEALLIETSSLMIDEPEISMHVDWQIILINSLRTLNEKMQLIFATHSPEIMADVPDKKIFRI